MTYRKFHNHVTTEYCKWAGKVVTFHSDKEKHRWNELNIIQVAGQIKDLERQTPFKFYHYPVSGRTKTELKPKLLFTYIADFTYHEKGEFVVEDVKGQKKKICPYPLKKKHMKVIYGVEILET